MQRCFSFRASAHVADVHIDLAVIAGDAGRAGSLPHLAGDGAAGHVIMGVPDGVLAQLAQIQPVAEPQGGGVHARLVAQRLDLLTERNGALGAVGDTQAIGAAIGAAGSLGIKVDGVIQLAAVQDIPAALGFLPCLVLVDGLAEEVDAHFQARVPGVGEMLLEHRVQHQRAGCG